MSFSHPDYLWLIALLPLWLLLVRRKGNTPSFFYFSAIAHPVLQVRLTWRIILKRSMIVLRSLLILLCILALAGPYRIQSETKKLGIDIVLALDISESMMQKDIDLQESKSRLSVVKKVVSTFIKGRKNDRIGLVVFGQYAVRKSPLTHDHEFVLRILEQVDVGDVEGSKTAIGAGLSTACLALEASESTTKVIILLTDGVENVTNIPIPHAIELASAMNIRVHSIGVGRNDPLAELYGQQSSFFDEGALIEIASNTGGKFFRAENEEVLASVYKEIDRYEKHEYTVNELKPRGEHSILLFLTWFILLGEMVALLLVRGIP